MPSLYGSSPVSIFVDYLHSSPLVDDCIVFAPQSQAYVLYGLLWNLGTKASVRDESGVKVSFKKLLATAC